MKESHRDWILLVVATGVGILIGWIDSRPTWDDAGITAIFLLGSSLLLGLSAPKHAWRWALSVGIWVPISNIVLNNNYQSILALAIPFIGAYAGAFFRTRLFSRA